MDGLLSIFCLIFIATFLLSFILGQQRSRLILISIGFFGFIIQNSTIVQELITTKFKTITLMPFAIISIFSIIAGISWHTAKTPRKLFSLSNLITSIAVVVLLGLVFTQFSSFSSINQSLSFIDTAIGKYRDIAYISILVWVLLLNFTRRHHKE